MGLVRVEIFHGYFWTQFETIHFLSLYLVGFCAMPIGFILAALTSDDWLIMRPILALVPPLVALALVSTTYFCPVCSNAPGLPDWCEVGVTGVPFPSRYFPADDPDIGPPTEWNHSCGEWTNKPYRHIEL